MADQNTGPAASASGAGPEAKRGAGPRWACRVAAFVLVVAGLFVAARALPVGRYIHVAADWMRALGWWAPACFVAMHVAATVLLISTSAMMVTAGVLFGMAGGFVPVTIGCTLGATASFLLGRGLLRGWAQRKIAGHPLLQAIDKVVEKKGFRIVLLIRLTPAPSVLTNYGFGLTRVKLRPYVLGTLLGMVPRSLRWLYLGWTAGSAADALGGQAERGPVYWVFLAAGVAATIVVTILIARMAHKALKGAIADGKKR